MRRGLAILFALEDDEALGGEAPGVVRIASLVGREKSQVSRTLRILAEDGLVDRDPVTLGYRLGWRLLAMAGRASNAALIAAVDPLLQRLVRELGERAHLSVLQGAEVLTVLSEAPDRAIQAAGWVGRTVPAYSSSSGRALLLDHDRERLAELFREVEFVAATPKTPHNVEELYDRISVARKRGFALVDEEFEAGLVAAAAPVRDFGGRIVAALNVSAPKFRFSKELQRAGVQLKLAADELSASIGWTAEGAPVLPGVAVLHRTDA
ncbi:MAG: IclR family transcriptional regulator [Actinobacteria bacterium]|nr:IclR family transcriptional regulator [Actinomycetota bacterium]